MINLFGISRNISTNRFNGFFKVNFMNLLKGVKMKKKYLATAVAALFAAPITTAIAADTLLDDVVVSSSRSEQRSFDAPGSIQSVNRAQIENGGPQINLSESLSSIPGINAANRNNYSQDLQVSIRGFGARAPFGVRGVKMFVDGLPASLSDGQGQTSQFALTSADRIEVLKGPISSLYGNASGGVLQVFTRSPGDKPELNIGDTWGSFGLNHANVQYSEKKGNIGFVLDSAHFKSDGFRQYSAAEREHLNAKLEFETERGKASFIVNYLDNKKSQDPGTLTSSLFEANPYQAQANNERYKAGKSFTQQMYGINFDGKLNADSSYNYRVYYGDRQLDNPTRVANTYIVIDRQFMGTATSLTTRGNFNGLPVKLTAGLEYDYVKDKRLGYTNNSGSKGTLNRQEDNLANSFGGFLQSEWYLSPKYTGLLGLRFTSVSLEVKDQYFDDSAGDGSGSKTYKGFSPVAGLTYHLNQNTNVYVQAGSGFETPTLNEVIYTPDGSSLSSNRFYGGISAARSLQVEAGVKWRSANTAKLDLTVFHAKTKNDIVPYFLSTSGSTWQNADTERLGLELSGLKVLPLNFAVRGAYTLMSAKYDQATSVSAGTVNSGNKLPGIPEGQFYADIAWRSATWLSSPKVTYTELGFDYRSIGKMYANSMNTQATESYRLLGARVSHNIKNGPHTLSFFGRVDNLTDKVYAGSVVVDQQYASYYEPGMPRNWILGVKYSLAMN